ncbi:Predicted dithiol-disulfide isomerase, DsbA family [Halobiforma haloterrestris]|uniref:Predicted dithiol-disulfide isomerase, DsbA family n=1 Tax=Natronobacterium haloterrestre TaxID=148448 RepID=A0A1I1CZW0_NATHA|nr:DsbA family oxidoreductase [Halobiforma haloterrestris]SFB68299.1 Predicted dithiol-disulfide isomerase, DsbA family [Halobiforma haloterrestris]
MSVDDAPDRLEVYADYVCPFCYLGKQSLARYRKRRDDPLEIEWHPYDLRRGKRNPDGSIDHDVDDGKDEEYFEQAKENVRRLQERYDVEMAQEIAAEVDSLHAQLASWYVKREYPEEWAAFDDAIYEALWQDGRDIGDEDVLVDLATDVGLPADAVTEALADDDLRATLEERFDAARKRGVTGVPTFVYEGHAARGAVPPEQLERLIEGEG